MKLRWKIAAALAVVVIAGVLILARGANREQRALEETRRELQRQGFKVDLSEFNFSTSPGEQEREAALNVYTRMRAYVMLPLTGSNSAVALWREPELAEFGGDESLPSAEEALRANRPSLGDACDAALAGPIRFKLSPDMSLQHLGRIRGLTQVLGLRAVVELRAGHRSEAWTSLLAATRLVTAWVVEPTFTSHLSQCASAKDAFEATWQMVQAGGWTDEQLAELQREWESVNFFRGLPEAAAWDRARNAAVCQQERRLPRNKNSVLKEMLKSPRQAWNTALSAWQQARYPQHGTYEDERDILLYYQRREIALLHALASSNWLDMQRIPGITNELPFQSRFPFRARIALSVKPKGELVWMASTTAAAEARRRLVITALALERFHLRRGAYPLTLAELTLEFPGSPPVDFMNGESLRYQATDDDHFVLYSVGLNCVDDGGNMTPQNGLQRWIIDDHTLPDLVWPRPATGPEVLVWLEENRREIARRRQSSNGRSAIP